MSKLPKVTFGIVNCNRLHYFRSCLESLLYCTEDYPNKEIIIIDNASVEAGTKEYLDEKEKQGHKVIRQKERDPSNEFPRALNLICENATGDYVCPLQGDVQFIIRGSWLKKYVEFCEKNKDYIGCVLLDAQRTIRNRSDSLAPTMGDFQFFYSLKRNPVSGAGDVFYTKKVIDNIFPWPISNDRHEGGTAVGARKNQNDSETTMIERGKAYLESLGHTAYVSLPQVPVAAVIHTDPHGTNAVIRGDKRYGDYWAPKEDFKYYKIWEFDEIMERFGSPRAYPVGIEDVVETIGFHPPLDEYGNWKKNPGFDEYSMYGESVEKTIGVEI